MDTGVIHRGDCLAILPTLPDNSIDAVCTDPPYHLTTVKRFGPGQAEATSAIGKRLTGGFMGKEWDGGDIAFRPDVWREVLRVLKPGGHLVSFGGTRTYHRMACAIEDVGFEIRDQLQWLYGSGFPKSLDVSKAVDGHIAVGRSDSLALREINETRPGASSVRPSSVNGHRGIVGAADAGPSVKRSTPAFAAAGAWTGWGTALKPACEPIVLARKPLSERSVALNVLRWSTGAINVDGARIPFVSEADEAESKEKNRHLDFGSEVGGNAVYGDYSMVPRTNYDPPGRWPANVLLDTDAAAVLDLQSGDRAPGHHPEVRGQAGLWSGDGGGLNGNTGSGAYTDTGGASRFFYTAKANAAERSVGMATRNTHPTVKPVDLMVWLVRLVTPPGGIVLDPFLGSGTTAIAATECGMEWIGIEREAEYVEIAQQRIGLMCSVV